MKTSACLALGLRSNTESLEDTTSPTVIAGALDMIASRLPCEVRVALR